MTILYLFATIAPLCHGRADQGRVRGSVAVTAPRPNLTSCDSRGQPSVVVARPVSRARTEVRGRAYQPRWLRESTAR